MTEDLLANAAWLQMLVGETCPWSIETAHDLREFALSIATTDHYGDELTGAELRRVRDLIESLAPPEERAQRARREKRRKKSRANESPATDFVFLDPLKDRQDKLRAWQEAGAKEKAQNGKRAAILSKLRRLTTTPPHRRAGKIIEELGLSPQYVRRVIRQEKLK